MRGSISEAVPLGRIRTGTGELSVRYSVLINTKEFTQDVKIGLHSEHIPYVDKCCYLIESKSFKRPSFMAKFKK